ncbi:hypothetical protein DIPPA_03800 [Diplonema papillatum]|nr:hypothetical protein DIPPA_03800 [Diplonema papillatum]
MSLSTDDFSVCDAGANWAVVHRPTGAEVVTLPKTGYDDVNVLHINGAPCVRVHRVHEQDEVDLPIRGSQAVPTAVVNVQVIGTLACIQAFVDPKETVLSLKQRLAPRVGVPAVEQALWLGKRRLDQDHVSIEETGACAPGVWLKVGRSGKIRLRARGIDGAPVSVQALPGQSIAELKEIIAVRVNTETNRFVLVLAGRRLPESATLKECGLRNGFEVEVARPGGMQPSIMRSGAAGLNDRDTLGNYRHENLSERQLTETVEDVVSVVHHLVDQQAKLSKTLERVVKTWATSQGSVTPGKSSLIRGGHTAGRPPDVLSQSRSLRAAASAEASAALRLVAHTPYRMDSLSEDGSSHRRDLLQHLSKAADPALEGLSSAASLSRMERLRHEYNLMRHDMNMQTLKRDNGSCKLCGSQPGGSQAIAAASEPGKTPATTVTATTTVTPAAATAAKVTPEASKAAAAVKSGSAASTTTATATATTGGATLTAAGGAAPNTASSKPTGSATPPPTTTPGTAPPAAAPEATAASPAGGAATGASAVGNADPSTPTQPVKPWHRAPGQGPVGKVVPPHVVVAPRKPPSAVKTDGDDSDDELMGDHVLGDPEAVEAWLRARNKM